MKPPVVVNIHRVHGRTPEYDIYIGRRTRFVQELDRDSKWHNPFSLNVYGKDCLKMLLNVYGKDCLKMFEMYAHAMVFGDLSFDEKDTVNEWPLEHQIALNNAIARNLKRFGRWNMAELTGKILGCWCKPGPCHGDVLVKLWKEMFDDE